MTCRRRKRFRKHSPMRRNRCPSNVDGAIGAILADLEVDLAAFNGIFMTAKPMRRIDAVNHGYDGPPARNL